MVTIDEVLQVRKYCRISLDNGEKYWIRQSDFVSACFRIGAEYDLNDFRQQIRICQYPHALNHAVSLLARRPYSKLEILNRLLRLNYTEDVSELVVYKLEKEHLLDDEDFCNQWVHFRQDRGFGPSVIRRELKMKGIPDEMIDRAFMINNSEKEYENAVRIARKAWTRFSSDDLRKKRQKTVLLLVRKGYDWDTARAACAEAESGK